MLLFVRCWNLLSEKIIRFEDFIKKCQNFNKSVKWLFLCEENNTYFASCVDFIFTELHTNAHKYIIEVPIDFCKNFTYTTCVISVLYPLEAKKISNDELPNDFYQSCIELIFIDHLCFCEMKTIDDNSIKF